MKRLSIGLPALALALALFVSVRAESPAAASTADKSHYMQSTHYSLSWNTLYTPKSESKKFDLSYYWYEVGCGFFDSYTTVAAEASMWWLMLGGVPVNTNMGGTLVAVGYQTQQSPYPSQYLYAHFPW